VNFNSADPRALSAQMFMQSTYGPGTIFPGYSGGPQGGSIPGLGMMNLFMQPALASFMQSNGMYPGDFSGGTNMLDLIRAQEELANRQRASALAAQTTDTQTWLQTTKGMANAMGAPWGLEQQAAYKRSYQSMAPFMAMVGQVAPGIVDALHGPKGSASVMVDNMYRGGKYRLDSISGLPGMTPESLSTLSQAVERNLYGSPEQIARMQGIGMGELGGIFDESARRGYLPRSLSIMSRESQLRALSAAGEGDVEALRGLDSAALGKKIQQFDANRITGRLKELSGSVSAMKELFGSLGQPDAPLNQIMNALEAITQNKLASMPAARVEQLVRQTKATMETTGIGLDAMQMLIADSANYGDRLGLDRSLAIQSGQGAALYGAAYKNAFGSSFTAFGASSTEVMMKKDALLRQNAAGSEQARFGGALIRSVEALGVDDDSEAGQLAAALRRGDTHFRGESIHTILQGDRLTQIMSNSGVNAAGMSAFRGAMDDKFGNQEYIERYGLGNTIRKLQGRELVDQIGRPAGEIAIMEALRGRGMDTKKARELAAEGGGDLLQALLNTDSPELLSSAEGRRKIIEQALTPTFGAEEAARMSASVALSFESQLNGYAQDAGYENIPQLLQAHNTTVLKQKDAQQRVVGVEADIAKRLSPLGKQNVVQRIMGVLQNNPNISDEELTHAFGSMMGGIEIGDIKKMQENINKIRTNRSKESLTPEEERATEKLEAELDAQVKAAIAANPEMTRQVKDEDLEAAAETMTPEQHAAMGLTPKEHAKAVDKELLKKRNIINALLTDKETRQNLFGGSIRTQRAHQSLLALDRLTGGDSEVLAAALRNDPAIDEDKRRAIQELYSSVNGALENLAHMPQWGETPEESEEFDAYVEKFMKSDEEQVKAIRKELAVRAGLAEEDISLDEIKKRVGTVDETKRRDIISALHRDPLLSESDQRTVQGSLGGIELGDSPEDIYGALDQFAPEPKKPTKKPADPAGGQEQSGRGGGGGRQKMELSGTLQIHQDGTATIAGIGYTDIPVS